ncbi:MAG: N-acetyltransferase GCN5 [Armatimonadetes bacterium CSP1-3]|nr:MAG: N-acetyltransferase GCN5 [Armatimonadetes bacterium CSP1-3]
MPGKALRRPAVEVYPVTPERWRDLETLFGERGAYGGCWCMWWRISRAEFSSNGNRGNRQEMKRLVDSGQAPGLLAYVRGEPIAWVSVGPRETFSALERSRTLKRVDDRAVWSVVCFVVAKPYRGTGLMTPLLRAAVDYAKRHGARIVEGYPIEVGGRLSGYSGFTGVASTFRKTGFVEVSRASVRQPIMRYFIRG